MVKQKDAHGMRLSIKVEKAETIPLKIKNYDLKRKQDQAGLTFKNATAKAKKAGDRISRRAGAADVNFNEALGNVVKALQAQGRGKYKVFVPCT